MAVDVAIVVVALAFAVWGFQQGLVVSLALAAGFGGGAFGGSRLAAAILDGGAESPYAPLIVLLAALALGAVAAIALNGPAHLLRNRVVRWRVVQALDRGGGAALLAAIAVAFAWIIGLTALNVPELSGARAAVQRSDLLAAISEQIPPSGEPLRIEHALDPLAELSGPETRSGAPKARVRRDRDVKRAARGVVRVEGAACGLQTAGSGWVATRRLVVTSAHLIAGHQETTVAPQKGPARAAVPVVFDAEADLAILSVKRLRAKPLARRTAAPEGEVAAAIGFPAGGRLDTSPARLGATDTVPSEDAYGEGPVLRQLTSFRGTVREGYSGGPLVDRRGRVLATISARLATDDEQPGGLAIPNPLVAEALRRAGDRVDSGPCAP